MQNWALPILECKNKLNKAMFAAEESNLEESLTLLIEVTACASSASLEILKEIENRRNIELSQVKEPTKEQ